MNKEQEQKASDIADKVTGRGVSDNFMGVSHHTAAYQSALEALQLKQKEVDKYKPYYDGVIDQCAVNHLPEQDTPYNTINMLCCWEADIALDPKVSERVAELHDKIASLQERCERLEEDNIQMSKMLSAYASICEKNGIEVGSSELVKNYPDKLLYQKKLNEWREMKGMDLTKTKGGDKNEN